MYCSDYKGHGHEHPLHSCINFDVVIILGAMVLFCVQHVDMLTSSRRVIKRGAKQPSRQRMQQLLK
jgi:hypothetical protein